MQGVVASPTPVSPPPEGPSGPRPRNKLHVVAATGLGAGLVSGILGIGATAAVGHSVPSQLWDIVASLSGGLLGLLIPSPSEPASSHPVMVTAGGSAKSQPRDASGNFKVIGAAVLAVLLGGLAAFLYAGPGSRSQCLASIGSLTNTVAQTATTGTAPTPQTVTGVVTVGVGRIQTGQGSDKVVTLQETAPSSGTKCPAVRAADSLVAIVFAVLSAILGILVPAYKPPDLTDAAAPNTA